MTFPADSFLPISVQFFWFCLWTASEASSDLLLQHTSVAAVKGHFFGGCGWIYAKNSNMFH